MTAVPQDIRLPWDDLLAKRALLHETRRQFDGVEDYGRKIASEALQDRKDAAALEHFAETAFNLLVDLSRELLVQMNPSDRGAIKGLGAEEVLLGLRKGKVFTAARWEVLDEIRGGRNALQHGASFVPWRAVWTQVELIEGNIDGSIADLQSGFAKVGVTLSVNFPDFDGS